MNTRGLTLMELTVASAISLVIILAMGQVDLTRLLLADQARNEASRGSEASLVMASLIRDAQRADRVNLLSPSEVQLRIPHPTCGAACACTNGVPTALCLDQAGAYRWVEYKLVRSDVVFYGNTANGCGTSRAFRDIGGFTVRYLDASQAPPGGDPQVQDNNVLQVMVTTTDPQAGSMTYTNTATLRAEAYTNLITRSMGSGDSGVGMDTAGVSAPPSGC